MKRGMMLFGKENALALCMSLVVYAFFLYLLWIFFCGFGGDLFLLVLLFSQIHRWSRV